MTVAPLLTDEGMQVLHVLDAVPQTIAQLCKRLRMTKGQLGQVVAQNHAGLVASGVRLHSATASEVGRAIALPSMADSAAPTYYSRISKEQPRET